MADDKGKRTARLGRGLSSLMARPVATTPAEPAEPAAAPTADPAANPNQAGTVVYLEVQAIQPNRHQPRQHFAESALQQLAASIKAEGLIQPIVVRPLPADRQTSGEPSGGTSGESSGGGYELVAGERRWRAAQIAGLTTLPAIVRDLDDQQLAEWALIENLQREDLNPIERAEAFRRLGEQFGLNHDQIASRVGVERSTVSNLLRLLGLDESVRQLIRDSLLSMGQARALAAVPDGKLQRSLAADAVRGQWSVRQLEQAVAAAMRGQTRPPAAPAPAARAGHLRDLEQQIGQRLGTRVRIRPRRKKGTGTLAIDFYGFDQFEAILARLGIQPE